MAVPMDRLGALGAEAIACRQLRHAWPRPPSPLVRLVDKRVVGWRTLVTREMECAAGCGTVAKDVLQRASDGSWTRLGSRRYVYPADAYLLPTRDENGESLPPVTADDLITLFMHAYFPDLDVAVT